jgi:hypothetical protein
MVAAVVVVAFAPQAAPLVLGLGTRVLATRAGAAATAAIAGAIGAKPPPGARASVVRSYRVFGVLNALLKDMRGSTISAVRTFLKLPWSGRGNWPGFYL